MGNPNKKMYPKGIYYNLPHEKAPDFVKGAIVIDWEVLRQWLKDTDVPKKEGKTYFQATSAEDKKNGGVRGSLAVNDYYHKEEEPVAAEQSDNLPF